MSGGVTDFWKTFHGKFIYSQSLWQKSASRELTKKYFFIFRLAGDAWPGIWTEEIFCYISFSWRCLAWDLNRRNILLYFVYLEMPDLGFEPKKYFVIFRLVGDAWPRTWTEAFTSNKPRHYLIYHSDFSVYGKTQ